MASESKEEPAPPPKKNQPLELSTNYKDYSLLGILGKGSFASVWFAKDKSKKDVPWNDYAVKIIELESSNPLTVEETQKETVIMLSLKHPNIVPCLSAFSVFTELWLVMPLLSGGSCAAIMRRHPEFKKGFRDEPLLATILQDVVKGLEYLHKEARIHRDIKAGNILLSSDGVAKISDFGVSGTLIENGYKKAGRMTFTGTPCWMAPEVMESKGHNHKADIWSLGITAIELAYGKPPYSDQRPMKVMLMIIQKDPPTVEQYQDKDDQEVNYSRAFHSFVKALLKKDPKKRPKAKELLSNSFFKKAKNATYIKKRILAGLPPQKIKAPSKLDMPKSLRDRESTPEQPSKSMIGMSFDFSENPKSHGRTLKSRLEVLKEIREEPSQNSPLDSPPAASPAQPAAHGTEPKAPTGAS